MLSHKNIFQIEAPLATKMRPKSISEFVGQEELLGESGVITKMLKSKNVYSMIFWGPPGSGKTSLARLIASESNTEFIELSAVDSGVKQVRSTLQEAKISHDQGKRTVVFIDEIHRFSKSQQDALLPAVESGLITLIGATTENPSFEVISALLSRAQVYVLNPLSTKDIKTILIRALERDFCEKTVVDGLSTTLDYLAKVAFGDARVALNTLQSAQEMVDTKDINEKLIDEILQKPAGHYKKGESHYNLVSAYIKSVRASDVDAALYYLARMVEAGEDPMFIARRMVVLASEDIGLANPYALSIAITTKEAVHFLGMPEARIPLAQCTIFLATCDKSNSAYLAIENALKDAKDSLYAEVPLHLRNAPTGLMKKLGYSKGYIYPHDQKNPNSRKEGHVKLSNFPKELVSKRYYFEGQNTYEKAVKERRLRWEETK